MPDQSGRLLLAAGTPGTFPTSGWPSSKAQGRKRTYAPGPSWAQAPRSWGAGLVGDSGSIWSSHIFVQRGRDLPQDTAPAQILVISAHIPMGKLSFSCHLLWNDLAVPSCARCCHGVQVSWDRDHLCSGERWHLPTWLSLLSTGPWNALPNPHLPQRPCTPWAPPSLCIYANRVRTGSAPTLRRGSPHCIDGEGTHPEDSEMAGRDGIEHPQASPLSSASPQFLTAKKPPSPSWLSVGPRPQSRVTHGIGSLTPGKTPTDGSSMHFTSLRHSPSVLLVGARMPLPPRLVSKLPFLERAQGPDRTGPGRKH